MPSESAIRPGPVGFQCSFFCVSALEAGISRPAKSASQPKCSWAASGGMLTAESAAFRVGYKSASQFSREYSRTFADSPGRDTTKIKERGLALLPV